MQVSTGGEIIYKGVYSPVAYGNYSEYKVDISIEDIIKPYMTTSNTTSHTIIVYESTFDYLSISITFKQGSNNLSYSCDIYNGGIGKHLYRDLYNKGTDIFAYKIFDTAKQFFLTTRTFGRHITVKENELLALFFIATNKTYSVVTEYGNVFVLPVMVANALYALNLKGIRLYSHQIYNKKPAFFGIMIDGQYVFDITVTGPSPAPGNHIIEFRNSFGVYERIEVSGRCISEPEFGEDNAFDKYDETVNDFIEQNERRSVREVINAELGYKTLEEFFFVRDMLQSNDRYLLDPSGNYHQVRVISENFSHDLNPRQPGSIPVKIRFIDTDISFSPEKDDSPPDYLFGEPVWMHGSTNGYGFLFDDSQLNTI
jgi:hypothetical protein